MTLIDIFFFVVLYAFIGSLGGLMFSTGAKKVPSLGQNAAWFMGVAVVTFLAMYLPRNELGDEINMVAMIAATLITAFSFVTIRHMKIVERGK